MLFDANWAGDARSSAGTELQELLDRFLVEHDVKPAGHSAKMNHVHGQRS